MFGTGKREDERPAHNGVTEEQVLAALRQLQDPDLHRDVVTLGMIKNVGIAPGERGAKVSFTFELTTPACPVKAHFESTARKLVASLPGVESVDVKMTANVRGSGPRLAGMPGEEQLLPAVKNTVAVASGKGGVGKSTVAANLAVALAQTGARVGLLDADIYGPSVPVLMGVTVRPRMVGNKLEPVEGHGLKLMSLGLLVDPDQPIIWRGPLVHGAVRQLLSDVDWGELDYLLIDLPPGTGDAQLSLVQAIPLSGVVIVSTPQDVALNIATKALQMFKSMHVPVLGIIENMSYYVCTNCGHQAHVFSHGGGEAAAARLSVPFLGEIPLDECIRVSGDDGRPVAVEHPDSPQARAFEEIGKKLAAQISIRNARTIPILRQA